MGSTRVGVLLSGDERNVARLNTADTPNSLYVPNQASPLMSPLKLAKSTNVWWTIPNSTFPMVGTPRWWNPWRYQYNAGTYAQSYGSAATYMVPLSVARTAQLLNMSIYVSALSNATVSLYLGLYQMTSAGNFSSVSQLTYPATTTTTGQRTFPWSYTLLAGVQYCMGFSGNGFTLSSVSSVGPPKVAIGSGTYGSGANLINAQAINTAQISVPYYPSQFAYNVSAFGWSDLNHSNTAGVPLVALQLRTI